MKEFELMVHIEADRAFKIKGNDIDEAIDNAYEYFYANGIAVREKDCVNLEVYALEDYADETPINSQFKIY